jgi:hypothetical protein
MKRVFLFGVLLLLLLPVLASTVLAATYWVSSNGAASWTACIGAAALSGTSACSLSTANSNAAAGDTVYLRGGGYSSYINPSKSGTSDTARITFQNYNGETVTLDSSSAINLNGKSYVTVSGMTSSTCKYCIQINGGGHNIISYNKFGPYITTSWMFNLISGSSQYNWLHHNEFHDFGSCVTSDEADVLDIGDENLVGDSTGYNLVEDNVFYHGGHHVIGIETGYNTIRNNYFHNEGWQDGYGNRVVYITNQKSNPMAGHNVIEGNRIGYAAKTCEVKVDTTQATMGIVAMSTPYNIFRYNALYYGSAYALGTSEYAGTSGSYNRIYSNTMFDAGLNDKITNPPQILTATYESEFAAIRFGSCTGNIVKNNIYYKTIRAYVGSSSQTFGNNFDGSTGSPNPLFVNAPADATLQDPMNKAIPDLNLQSGSPAIDYGGALTTVASADSGSGTTLRVTDAYYFQDGSYAPSGTVQADWIAVGTVGNVVKISSIDYATNTITLASSITRKAGDSIWLYRKSDGVQVLYGNAPDAGAYEYTGSAPPVQTCTNDCSSGAKQCSGNSVQACGNYDTDSCLEWGGTTACASGTTCSAGVCKTVSSVVSADVNGDGKVDIGDLSIIAINFGRKAGDANFNSAFDVFSDGIIDIADLSFVASRFSSSVGSSSCTDGTAYGVCSTNKPYYCNNGTLVSRCSTCGCPSAQTCSSAGTCISAVSCTNDCSTSGLKQCSGNSVQTCGNYDTDSCLEWGGTTACASGQTCSNGACITTTTPPSSGTALPVDAYISMEGNSIQEFVNNAKVVSGGGRWFVGALSSSNPAMYMSNNYARPLRGPVSVGGVVYSGASANSMALVDDMFEQWIEFDASAYHSIVTYGGFYTAGIGMVPYCSQDNFVGLDGNSYASTPQIMDDNGHVVSGTGTSADGTVCHPCLHLEGHLNGQGTVYSDPAMVPLVKGKTYWFTTKMDFTEGKLYLRVYDPDNNYSLVPPGEVTGPMDKVTNQNINVKLGRQDSHTGNSHQTSISYEDQFIIDWTNHAWPLLP